MGVKAAVTGNIFSGKSTVGRLLEPHGFYFIDYTGLLKFFAAQAIELATGEPVTQDYIAAHKRDFRLFLQAYGSALRFEDGFAIERVIQAWREAGASENVFFDNIRSAKQFEKLLAIEPNFILVRIEIDAETQYQRALKQGIGRDELTRMNEHHIEGGMGVKPDVTIDGRLDPHDIANIFLRMAGLKRS